MLYYANNPYIEPLWKESVEDLVKLFHQASKSKKYQNPYHKSKKEKEQELKKQEALKRLELRKNSKTQKEAFLKEQKKKKIENIAQIKKKG